MKTKHIVHLLSGGLDSVTMLYDLKDQGHSIHCLLFNYKQRHVQELLWAKQHAQQCGILYTVIELPNLGGLTEQSWIVPNRNAIFLSVAVNFACKVPNADTVTIGCNKDDADYFPDCRAEFIIAMNCAVKAAGYDITIEAPYLEKAKWEIGALAQEFGIRPNEIWTCYHGGEKPCGKCPACQKANAAFRARE